MFEGSAIKNIVIPSTVTSVGTKDFLNCEQLESAVFNNTLEAAFPTNMFQGCTNLQSVKLPEGIISIGTSTFDGCTKLKKLRIPRTVTSSITANAFNGWGADQTICLEMTRFELFSLFTSFDFIFTDVHSAKIVYGVTEEAFNQLP